MRWFEDIRFLIATMLDAGVYSACDELLDFLESCQTSLRSHPGFFRKIREFFRSNSNPSEYSCLLSNKTPFPLNHLALRRLKMRFSLSVQTWITKRMRCKSHVFRPQPSASQRRVVDGKDYTRLGTAWQVMTTWLQERVNRARYVIVCCSSILKQIVDAEQTNVARFNHQIDYNLKFAFDILVTGVIYRNFCRNPKGKYIPILLPEHDPSNLLVPLCYFMTSTGQMMNGKSLNYIMNM